MLSELRLKNFQGHEKLRIRFDPRITCIVGPSDAGKSAILRAIRWLCLNDPSGHAFVRAGSKRAAVMLRAFGHQFVRIRGTATNAYKLDGRAFKAFGTDVPEEIAGTLRIGETNFQRQYDSPFWFNDSPPEVSRQLNAIVNLDIIDATLSDIASEIRDRSKELKYCKERRASARDRCRGLAHVQEMQEDLEKIEALQTASNTSEIACNALADQIEQVEQAQEHVRKVGRVSKAMLDDLAQLEALEKARGATGEAVFLLSQAMADVRTAKQAVKRWTQLAKTAHQEFHDRTKGEKCPVCGSEMK